MEISYSSSNPIPTSQHNLPSYSNTKYNGVNTITEDTSQNNMKHLMPSSDCPSIVFHERPSSPRRLITTNKKTMHVRALFDYDPTMDSGLPSRGLPFQHGDILHVVNASDREWWQARRISLASDVENAQPVGSTYSTNKNNSNYNSTSTQMHTPTLTTTTTTTFTGLGIIPSCQRIERRQKTRLKRVNFVGKVTVIGATPYTHSTSSSNPSVVNSTAPLSSPWDISNNISTTVNSNNNNNCNNNNNNGSRITDFSGGSNNSNLLRNNSLDVNARDSSRKMSIGSETSNNDPSKKKRSSSLTRNLFKCFSHRSIKNDSVGGVMTITRTGSLDTVNQNRYPAVRSYDLVVPITISMSRPLILFGPLKDQIFDELLLKDIKYTTCLLHTSRPQRPNERNGIDYYFVTSKSTMEEDIKQGKYIEINRFQDNYYAISLDTIRSTLQSGQICILDVGLDSAKYLDEIGLFPITILLKPKSITHLRVLQRRLTEDQAKRLMESIQHIEDENWRFLSAIMTYESVENLLTSIHKFVQLHSGPVIWVPSTLSVTNPDVQCPTGTSTINHNQIIIGNNNQNISALLPPAPQPVAASSSSVNATVNFKQYNNNSNNIQNPSTRFGV
uniref:Guanylate kinase-like domain-containing protein n=1 Tax=Trichobilharzia regenti TaxID=157069 RepID=A0AA85JC59_TRIRE|nr:unnamed protein product [Trichobilharzia regenti]